MSQFKISWERVIPLTHHTTSLGLKAVPTAATHPYMFLGEIGARGGQHWYLSLTVDDARALVAGLTATIEKLESRG